jgi:hypothetical protein
MQSNIKVLDKGKMFSTENDVIGRNGFWGESDYWRETKK